MECRSIKAKIEFVPFKPFKDGKAKSQGMFLVSGAELTIAQMKKLKEAAEKVGWAANNFGIALQQKQAPPQKEYSPKKHRPAPSWPAVGTPSTWRPKKLAELKSEENHDNPNRFVSGASLPERPIDPERRD